MLAVIEKAERGYIARFERPLHHSAEEVWAALTENDKLAKWMPNLQVTDLRKGGTIKFNMNDGTGAFFDIKITDFEQYSVLEYEWGEGRVRFELYAEPDGCLLVLKEFINSLNDHTSKDLAGWHVCLDMLRALMDGRPMDFPKEDWENWYEQYRAAVNEIKK
ncbi:SRPBCC family protein [Scopulibacillus cellulosilyticus]|uniref:SRPBCC family protein n=1 Tax=Scopulibacillus cellulosilyticus TaxID=2665665 RepID=A0ABW2PWR6_9BACL